MLEICPVTHNGTHSFFMKVVSFFHIRDCSLFKCRGGAEISIQHPILDDLLLTKFKSNHPLETT